MTNDLAVSMAELESEGAELLPSRETLYCWRGGHSGGHNVTNTTFTHQSGMLDFNNSPVNILDGNNVNVLGLAWQTQ